MLLHSSAQREKGSCGPRTKVPASLTEVWRFDNVPDMSREEAGGPVTSCSPGEGRVAAATELYPHVPDNGDAGAHSRVRLGTAQTPKGGFIHQVN